MAASGAFVSEYGSEISHMTGDLTTRLGFSKPTTVTDHPMERAESSVVSKTGLRYLTASALQYLDSMRKHILGSRVEVTAAEALELNSDVCRTDLS